VPRLGVARELHVAARALSASTISSLRLMGTTLSFSPWKTHVGSPLSRRAMNGLPPPQIGAIAAKRSGCCVAVSHVPKPPMLRPVR
jgi:hypothetical protein